MGLKCMSNMYIFVSQFVCTGAGWGGAGSRHKGYLQWGGGWQDVCKDPLRSSKYIVSLTHDTLKPWARKSTIRHSHMSKWNSVFFSFYLNLNFKWFRPTIIFPFWISHLVFFFFFSFISSSPLSTSALSLSPVVVVQVQQQIQRKPPIFSLPTSPSSLWTAAGGLASSWPSTSCRICCTGSCCTLTCVHLVNPHKVGILHLQNRSGALQQNIIAVLF